jgi:hypothetical protein
MSGTTGTGPENSLPIKIAGEIIKVYADEGPEYISRMANYINYIIDDFNSKKGSSVRQTILLIYAALELCNTLFQEREGRMTEDERKFEKMYEIELFNHKKTQNQLEAAEKRLAETERQLAEVRKDLDDFVNAFDLETGKTKKGI